MIRTLHALFGLRGNFSSGVVSIRTDAQPAAASALVGIEPMEETVDEKRRHPRNEVEELAHVSFNGTSLSCLIRNISAEGAAIDVENAAYIPERFRLVMPTGETRSCRLVWIKQNRIGVAFGTAGASSIDGSDTAMPRGAASPSQEPDRKCGL